MSGIEKILVDASAARKSLNVLGPETIDRILERVSEETVNGMEFILSENARDLALMDKSNPLYDRLMLNEDRLRAISSDILKVAGMESPLGQVLSEYTRPDGLAISRISVPFGVIGIIYEARPNVTFDVFSLCLKSGNVCILKGGSDAINSNLAIVQLIKDVLAEFDVSQDILTLLPPGREETSMLLKAREYVDLIIPRGSRSLIDFVRANSEIPVIETGAGICHTYFDEYGDREKGRKIIHNAKTRRVSVCNALDCLIIHESRLADLPYITELCGDSGVEVFADNRAYEALKGNYPPELLRHATEESFGTEFLSLRMSVKTVRDIEGALEHIEKYGSRHSEAIISEDSGRTSVFFRQVDASSVYSNASTAFTDGGEFGLGAEIGISTQKLHARGPMALRELTTYKWIIRGEGHVRKP
ncbi:MAG TPA: glutamate-5-semialdehyde dehydrogenase [Bacteroidales bacterium]|nr:glutamate-5-semialdehyde dehydrogenase [Bacteroidales bacterium]HNY53290.1 glutamate-5-semialdehyde dehydrogenase [Bacteroidales bacterium]HOG57438.1 glutamate-5-semialdehyde dehydrogenase [Bacteroidales bacterium]HPV17134.1 glutamate-5-semialdehyde dehydrogenase [Bacteroidales bacterium]HPX44509.1 glutamate-5-semialdehyde dehydrogenase [Bacteroidales bacterium]